MKSILTLLLSFLIAGNLLSQESKHQYILFFSPSNATQVDGIMINLFPKDEFSKNFTGYPKINGIELNVNPLGLFTPFVYLMHTLDPEIRKPFSDTLENIDFTRFKIINGLQIGSINMEPSIINGLDINFTGSFMSKSNGITMSLIMNRHYIINGLTFAFIGNHDIKCNGLQIGLTNSCNELKGFQLGLWNRNQKREMPFINWYF